jgi:hypothetical protein
LWISFGLDDLSVGEWGIKVIHYHCAPASVFYVLLGVLMCWHEYGYSDYILLMDSSLYQYEVIFFVSSD